MDVLILFLRSAINTSQAEQGDTLWDPTYHTVTCLLTYETLLSLDREFLKRRTGYYVYVSPVSTQHQTHS